MSAIIEALLKKMKMATFLAIIVEIGYSQMLIRPNVNHAASRNVWSATALILAINARKDILGTIADLVELTILV